MVDRIEIGLLDRIDIARTPCLIGLLDRIGGSDRDRKLGRSAASDCWIGLLDRIGSERDLI